MNHARIRRRVHDDTKGPEAVAREGYQDDLWCSRKRLHMDTKSIGEWAKTERPSSQNEEYM